MIWFNLWNHMEVDLIQYRPAFQPPLLGRLTIKKECNNVQLAGQSSWYDPVARVAVLIFPGHIHNLVRTSRLRKKLKTPQTDQSFPYMISPIDQCPLHTHHYWHHCSDFIHLITLVIWVLTSAFVHYQKCEHANDQSSIHHRGARTFNTNVFI